MPLWRSKAFYLTRNRSFLIKGCACILGGFIALALTAHFISTADATKDTSVVLTPAGKLLQSSNVLLDTSDKSPEHLLELLKEIAALNKRIESSLKVSFDEDTQISLEMGGNLKELIEQHDLSPDQRELFFNYARCLFAGKSVTDSKARIFLREKAETSDAIRYAAEFHADILVLENKQKEALSFYLRETVHPDAAHARLMAAKLAIAQEDISALRQLANDKTFLRSCPSFILLKMAKLLHDRALLAHGLWTMQLDRLSQSTALCIALFSAFLWLVLLTGSAGLPLRQAINYLPALLAGMLSVWLLHIIQVLLQYDVNSALNTELPMTHQIFYWVKDVGLPEETVKLCLFVPFLPFLLRQRSAAKAALTAGCVGLGFALNENLQYYQDFGVTVAMARLLTANIIHISLAGLLGYELYLLFQSRFHRATDFLLTFGAAALTHGLYDFCNSDSAFEGSDLASIIIVALSARRYLHCLHGSDNQAGHQPVSRTCIFCFGSCLLVGVLMVVTVIETQNLRGITHILKEAISLATVALIYVREFHEV